MLRPVRSRVRRYKVFLFVLAAAMTGFAAWGLVMGELWGATLFLVLGLGGFALVFSKGERRCEVTARSITFLPSRPRLPPIARDQVRALVVVHSYHQTAELLLAEGPHGQRQYWLAGFDADAFLAAARTMGWPVSDER